jgi:hypothetical protein
VSVAEAVDKFLNGRELDGRAVVLAAVARALAAQLDVACDSGTSRGLSAAPPIARRLIEVLNVLDDAGEQEDMLARVEAMLRPLRKAA